MTASLESLLSPASWPTLAFVLTRVTGMVSAAPLWSVTGLPRSGRAAVAILLTAALLPGVAPIADPEALVVMPVQLGMEFLLGLFIGLTASVLVQGLALAGEILGIQMGVSLAPVISPMAEITVPGIGQLKSFLGMMIYVSMDGHLMLLRGLADSLEAFPPGLQITVPHGPALAGHLLGTLYTSALQAAAPAMVALVVVDIAVGITSRAVPQLPAILVLFPVTIGLGLIMFGVSLPAVASTVAGWMGDLPGRLADVLGAFEGGR